MCIYNTNLIDYIILPLVIFANNTERKEYEFVLITQFVMKVVNNTTRKSYGAVFNSFYGLEGGGL